MHTQILLLTLMLRSKGAFLKIYYRQSFLLIGVPFFRCSAPPSASIQHLSSSPKDEVSILLKVDDVEGLWVSFSKLQSAATVSRSQPPCPALRVRVRLSDYIFPPATTYGISNASARVIRSTFLIFPRMESIKDPFQEREVLKIFGELRLPVLRKLTFVADPEESEIAWIVAALEIASCDVQVIDFQTSIPLSEVG
ncbi:hypothetical protein EDB19DRAFT_2043193, partial [Suillus lakei]